MRYKSNNLNLKKMDNQEKSTESAQVTKPAYIMVQMKVNSLEELNQRYAQFAIPILMKHGGQMIAGTPAPNVKEGEWDGNWAAVLQFPSMEAAEGWYNSEEYQPYKNLRINELQSEAGRVVIIPGM
ncbi:hypothetical protein DD829_20200 [Chryseobacterium sp. HMWF035]|nr:hypothetical protein DD829_20200 [Chryseobacterium sp. HMWF035]